MFRNQVIFQDMVYRFKLLRIIFCYKLIVRLYVLSVKGNDLKSTPPGVSSLITSIVCFHKSFPNCFPAWLLANVAMLDMKSYEYDKFEGMRR